LRGDFTTDMIGSGCEPMLVVSLAANVATGVTGAWRAMQRFERSELVRRAYHQSDMKMAWL
jgi:hypothetical protein